MIAIFFDADFIFGKLGLSLRYKKHTLADALVGPHKKGAPRVLAPVNVGP